MRIHVVATTIVGARVWVSGGAHARCRVTVRCDVLFAAWHTLSPRFQYSLETIP